MVYCVNRAHLFFGFPVREWNEGTKERDELQSNENYKDPWNNDDHDGDVQCYFDAVMGEESGFALVVLIRGEHLDHYIASTACNFESNDWEPETIPGTIDVDELKRTVDFTDACEKLGIACREPSLILVSEACPST